MKDLTEGPLGRHLVQMSVPIAAGMLFQTLYFLIDLYFVSRLGDAALAGVGAGGNFTFLVFALTQVLGVGTVTLISQAVGRKDRDDATLVFNQSIALAAACAVLTLAGGYALAGPYMNALAANPATAAAGTAYLYWFLPSLALQFALVVMGSALRGTGIVQPAMAVQVLTVILNAVLAPVLIAGWGTGHPLGVAGAGLASSVAVALGVLLLGVYFVRLEKYVSFDAAQWRPRSAVWLRLLRIGLPAGGEFALMFLFMGVMYSVTRAFGEGAQAGFGVGMRVMQCLFLPAMAVSFATAPIIGQNFGAGRYQRVRDTFLKASVAGALIMGALLLLAQWRAGLLIHPFTADPQALAVGTQFLRICSWNFVASGLVFTSSAVFQGLGNTLPAIMSAATRLFSFVIPVEILSLQPDFRIVQIWYVSVISVSLQALVSLWLVRREFRRRLPVTTPATG